MDYSQGIGNEAHTSPVSHTLIMSLLLLYTYKVKTLRCSISIIIQRVFNQTICRINHGFVGPLLSELDLVLTRYRYIPNLRIVYGILLPYALFISQQRKSFTQNIKLQCCCM